MFTEFFRPSDAISKRVTEAIFVIEKQVTERASLFVEYAGDYPESGSPAQLLNSGGSYRPSWIFTQPWGSTITRPVTLWGSDIQCVLMSCSESNEAPP
jgi:hypothetical protein